MRRAVALAYDFARSTARQHPRLEFQLANYRSLLFAMNIPEAEIEHRLQSLLKD